ncbi:MAG: iron complex outermembrane receptor protein [Halioglobus sp.]|jgi:iron complex outermembrane receptor protein
MYKSLRKPRFLTAGSFTTFCALALSPPASLAAPVLEEVIVTAEKREESLQDVPISIAAFSQDSLEKLGINDIKGLASKVPNLLINEFTGSSTTVRMFIRGVGQNDVQVTQDPSVALYMDGVYIGSSVGTAFESADIRRIEVLRGPQGTLYGRNTTGGAINLITNRADPELTTFKQTLTAGNLDLFRSRTILNVPLSDTTAIKLAYSTGERDGFVENIGNGEDFGKEDRQNFTADLHWDISKNGTLDYKYEKSTIEDTARLSQLLQFDRSAPLSGVISFANPALDSEGNPVEVSSDRLDTATSFDEQMKGDVEIDAHTLNVAWDLNDNLALKSITGYRKLDAYTQNAQTPTTILLGQYSITNGLPDTEFEQFTQEFQLLGNTDTLTWVGGVFYYQDESEEENLGDSSGSEAIPPGELIDFTSTENTSLAIFGQATWSPEALQDRWHFTFGARYSEDNRKAFRDNNRVSFGLGGAATPVPAFTANYEQDFSKFNPSVTVEYELNEYSNVYAKIVTAYKSGGTSQRSTSSENFGNGFDEEDLISYELGYKSDLADGRVRLNGALFHMDYENYQQSVSTGRNAGERDFVNIEDATITGLEVDVTVAITDNLIGTFSYGYLDTEFGPDEISYLRIDDASPTGFSVVTDPLTETLALAPEHSATFTLDYSQALSFGVLDASANAQYQDGTNSGVTEPTGQLDERTLLGASLGISEIRLGSDEGQLRVTLWGRNLLDEEYYVGNIRQDAFDSLGLIGLATFGDPRTYGITLEYRYN